MGEELGDSNAYAFVFESFKRRELRWQSLVTLLMDWMGGMLMIILMTDTLDRVDGRSFGIGSN